MGWKLLWKPIKFEDILLNILFYVLGVAVARYLGGSIDWTVALIGQLSLLGLHLGMVFLHTHFTMDKDFLTQLQEFFKLNQAKRVGDQLVIDRPRYLFALISLPFFSLSFLSLFLLIQQGVLTYPLLLILLMIVALWGFMVIPPVQLLETPYRDLASGVLWVIFYPAFGMMLLENTLSDVLFFFTLPLFMVFLAMRIARQFETYDDDTRYEQKTLLVQIGWENGMRIHNFLLLTAFLVLVLVPFLFSLSWALVWPALIALPFAFAQLIQMIQIARGGKPKWRLLRFNAKATLFLLIYLIIFSLLIY
ncbi:MAG: hypothetical protein J7K85_00900 [Anaerolineaceae bacterium]|nr:hypothetical protein [Anaerolineaceae bacterium]